MFREFGGDGFAAACLLYPPLSLKPGSMAARGGNAAVAGESLRQAFQDAGYPYRNRRSETFGIVEDISTTLTAIASGQIPPRDIGAAAKGTIAGASQRVVTRTATALAGAVALTVAGVPNKARTGAI